MFESVSGSFQPSSYPEATEFDPEEGFAPVASTADASGDAEMCFFAPKTAPKPQTAQEPAIDETAMFAPHPVAAAPSTTSPARPDDVFDANAVGPTPNFAPTVEASVSSSCRSTPVDCGDEFASGHLTGTPSEMSFQAPRVQTESPMDDRDVEFFGPMVKSLDYTCSVPLGYELPTKHMVGKMVNVHCTPKQSSRINIRLNNRGVTGRIFSNGRVLVQGAKSEGEARKSLTTLIRQVKRALPSSYKFEVSNMVVGQIVAHLDLGIQVDLSRVCSECQERGVLSELDFQKSAALLIRIPKLGASVMLQGSGKCTIHGAKTRRNLKSAVDIVYDLARKNEY